jgi:hydroxymethylglutaryl-CoA synthase
VALLELGLELEQGLRGDGERRLEQLLHRGDCPGRHVGQSCGERMARGEQILVGDDSVDDAPGERAVGGQAFTEHRELGGTGRTDAGGEPWKHSAVGHHGDVHEGEQEARGLGGDDEVGGHRQRESQSGRGTLDRGDHRLGHLSHGEDDRVVDLPQPGVQIGIAVLGHLPRHLHIGSGAERTPRPGEKNSADPVIGGGFAQRRQQLAPHLRRPGIEGMRSVELHVRDGPHAGDSHVVAVHVFHAIMIRLVRTRCTIFDVSHDLLSYGAYVPRARLQRSDLGSALGTDAGVGSRAIASFDEDSTTMGVEAARAAVFDGARPASVFFATTAPAYFDKTNATAIHAALDLGHEGFAVDLAGSVRGAVGALRAAQSSGGLAVLSDLRTGRPESADEREGGDAAAAFLFGEGQPILKLVSQASVTREFLDRWREPGAQSSGRWEERFGLETYLPLIAEASSRALALAEVEQADHVIVSSPHARAASTAARRLPGRIPEAAPAIGYSGAADAGVRLAAVLDEAQPGELILLIVAADGCDAAVYRTTEALATRRGATSVATLIERGRDVPYTTYLTWRGLLEREPPRRPEPERPSAPPSLRAEDWKFAFVGSRCDVCGQVHVPPRRVCVHCGATDQMTRAPLAGHPGRVATCTVDRLAFSPSPPVIDAVIDFDGGGRYTLEVTDADPEDVDIDTAVELTFRRLYTSGGIHNYFWKARPI